MHGSLPGLAAGRFGVIMFFSACRLPSFAPEDPPSHASENQITTGQPQRATPVHYLAAPSRTDHPTPISSVGYSPLLCGLYHCRWWCPPCL